MNIYLLVEDDVNCCIKAKTMAEAVEFGETIYINERREDDPECDYTSEVNYYHTQILQSCSFVGELKN